MKTTKISELPIVPEQYGAEVYEKVDWTDVHAEMTDGERRFINGLIQYYQPENVLEIGVALGGGTVNLLNSLKTQEGALYSIDSERRFYRNADLPVGHCAVERYSELQNIKWHLITGKDPVSVMEEIDKKFDFCVIDSNHRHPVETLNFISVLPWLCDGAIVVLHDTSVFTRRWEVSFLQMLAPRLLLSAVCAEKYIPDLPNLGNTPPNIAAWQVSGATRKYCQNLFDVLYLQWEAAVPQEIIKSVSLIVEKQYGDKMLTYFQEAWRLNKSMFIAKEFGIPSFEHTIALLGNDTVFYGAGAKLRQLISILEYIEVDFIFPIWDKNAEVIIEIHGHKVSIPDFEVLARSEQIMIITIEDEKTAAEVRKQFEPLGYNIFHGLKEYVMSKE